jgi:hypothetical protein
MSATMIGAAPKTSEAIGLSLPDIAERTATRLDWLRRQVRNHPQLAALFVRAGSLRVLPAERLSDFVTTLSRVSRSSGGAPSTSSARPPESSALATSASA